MNEQKLLELKRRLTDVHDLRNAGAVLYWDQTTHMPPGGAEGRGRQQALLAQLAHERFIDPENGRLLDELQAYADSLPYDHDDAAYLRVARRDYERAVKVPPQFIAELSSHRNESYVAWEHARPENDFGKVRPMLEKTLELSRRYAGYFAPFAHVADPLIDEMDYGMTAAVIRPLFAELRARLAPLVHQVTAQPPADDACLRQRYGEAQQWQFNLDIARQIGYDFNRGRLDKTAHPFTTGLGAGDGYASPVRSGQLDLLVGSRTCRVHARDVGHLADRDQIVERQHDIAQVEIQKFRRSRSHPSVLCLHLLRLEC